MAKRKAQITTFTDKGLRALKPEATPYKLAEKAAKGEGRNYPAGSLEELSDLRACSPRPCRLCIESYRTRAKRKRRRLKGTSKRPGGA